MIMGFLDQHISHIREHILQQVLCCFFPKYRDTQTAAVTWQKMFCPTWLWRSNDTTRRICRDNCGVFLFRRHDFYLTFKWKLLANSRKGARLLCAAETRHLWSIMSLENTTFLSRKILTWFETLRKWSGFLNTRYPDWIILLLGDHEGSLSEHTWFVPPVLERPVPGCSHSCVFVCVCAYLCPFQGHMSPITHGCCKGAPLRLLTKAVVIP